MAPEFYETDAQQPQDASFRNEPPRAWPDKPKKRRGCAFWIAIAGVVVVGGMLLIIIAIGVLGNVILPEPTGRSVTGPTGVTFMEQTIEGYGPNKILLIPINGIITDATPTALGRSRAGLVAVTSEMLKTAQTDPNIRAVILAIDSPGGGITASDVLHHAITKFREETNLPVVALLGDVAASGGYYVASAADHVVAHPTTVTGSIGVIMNLMGIKDLMTKLGIEARPIKSGELKDMGSIFRDITDKEVEMLQGMVDEYQRRLVNVVANGFALRGVEMSRSELEKHCDGRVFSGGEAVKIGFVDETGYLEDAIAAAMLRAGLSSGTTQVVTYQTRPTLFDLIMAKAATPEPNTLTVRIEGLTSSDSPRFLYLWSVGQPSLRPSF